MKDLSWRSVTGGIIALISIVVLVTLVLVYARSGALHGHRFRLFVVAPDASSLRSGSDVWLSGQRVGLVRGIRFNPASSPVDRRVIIELEVLSDVRDLLRADSRASLRSGGTVIGEPVVYLDAGTAASRAVMPDDTLHAAGNPDLEIASSKATRALEQLPVLMANTKIIIANGGAAATRLGALANDTTARRSLSRNIASLRASLGKSYTSLAMLSDTALRGRVAASMAGLDSLHQLLVSRSEAVGRFRRDSTLVRSVSDLNAEVTRLRAMAESPNGTLGRIRADSALKQGLDSAMNELASLIADIHKHPLRYAHVF